MIQPTFENHLATTSVLQVDDFRLARFLWLNLRSSIGRLGLILSALDFNEVPKSPGAYAIAARIEVNRVVGVDKDGILHVGESKELRDRIKRFHESAGPTNAGTHSAGWRYRLVKLHKIIPFETLYVRWIVTSSKDEATKAEANMLTESTKLYHELPPLNYKFNWAVDDLLKNKAI